MKKIKLSQGKFALVDDKDFDFLNQWKWYYHPGGYAFRKDYFGRKNGKKIEKTIFMHRIVNKTPSKLHTDHVNGKKLDNQRKNLRSCNRSQNRANASTYRAVKGVYKAGIAWRACIKVNGKTIHLGSFAYQTDASKAYDKAAKKHFKKFAKTNK